jgi:hypothetical protein
LGAIQKGVVIGDADYLAQKKHIKQELHWIDGKPQPEIRITASGIDIVESSIDKSLQDVLKIADNRETKKKIDKISKETDPKNRAKMAYVFFFKEHPELTSTIIDVVKLFMSIKAAVPI